MYLLSVLPQLAQALRTFDDLNNAHVCALVFTANGKRQIRVYVSSEELVNRREYCKIILAFDANAKLLNFT